MKRFLSCLIIIFATFSCANKEGGDTSASSGKDGQKKPGSAVVSKKAVTGMSAKSSSRSGTTGRIIDITDTYIVIKSGSKESRYYLASDSVFYDQAGDKLSNAELWICHYVTVNSVVAGGRKTIKTLQVIKHIKCD